jgi:hypothetical protein
MEGVMTSKRGRTERNSGLRSGPSKARGVNERVVIKILGTDAVDVVPQRLVRLNTQQYLAVSNGEQIVWKNPNPQPYIVVFRGQCPYGHKHRIEECRLTVPARKTAVGGRVVGKKNQEFEFAVRLAGGHRGTPKIIIQ